MKTVLFASVIICIASIGCSKKIITSTINYEPSHKIVDESNKIQDSILFTFPKEDNSDTIVVYFDFDKYDIKLSEINKLDNIAINKTESVTITGNCDERGSDEYNYSLGMKRAESVKDYLHAYNAEIASNGKRCLAEYGCKDEYCHAKNRRAVIVIKHE